MRSFAICFVFLTVLLSGAARAQTSRPPQKPKPQLAPAVPVAVNTWVSRTAIWVGEPVDYVVEFRAAPNVEILTDDLQPDRLNMNGLEALEVSSERDESDPETTIHRMRYRLVTYEVDDPELKIAAAPVRYAVREPGQRPEDAAPAGELQVPPLVLGFRSTLPASDVEIGLRDSRGLRSVPLLLRIAQPLGIALIVISAVPAVLWTASVARETRRWWVARPRRRPKRERRDELDAIRSLPVGSAAERREAFARLDAWIREQLQNGTDVSAAALTPGEISAALTRPPSSVHLPDVQRLMTDCEQAKYAPEPPGREQWAGAVEVAQQLLQTKVR